MVPLDGSPVVEMQMFQKTLMDTVYQQLGRALEDLGLDHRPRRLNSAVLALLAEPEQVRNFINGKPLPFH